MTEDFEQQLRHALARKEPPPFSEARILAAVRQSPERRFWSGLIGARAWTATAAAVLLVAGVAWEHERTVREEAAGRAAKVRLELALKITSAKLHKIQQQVEAASEGD